MTWKFKGSLPAAAMMTMVVSTQAHAGFTYDLRRQPLSNALLKSSNPVVTINFALNFTAASQNNDGLFGYTSLATHSPEHTNSRINLSINQYVSDPDFYNHPANDGDLQRRAHTCTDAVDFGEGKKLSIADLAATVITENDLAFPAIPSSLIWKGNLSKRRFWDVSSTANWNNLTTGNMTSVYNSGDNVTFDDSASNFSVILNTFVTPSSVTINANSNYTLSGSGSIGGSTSIAKSGNGTLSLGMSNSYSGGTFLNAGILAVNADADLGSSTGNLTFNGGTLAITGNALPVFPAARNIALDKWRRRLQHRQQLTHVHP